MARLNGAELGGFDGLVLGLFPMAHFKGQDSRRGLRLLRTRRPHFTDPREPPHRRGELHARAIAQLRRAALLIEDEEGNGTTYDDAVGLAKYERLAPHTTEWDGFVKETTAGVPRLLLFGLARRQRFRDSAVRIAP
jgi:hypothetical protein